MTDDNSLFQNMTDGKQNAFRDNLKRLKQLEAVTDSAMQLWSMYNACKSVGFSDEQALRIVLKLIEVAR